MKDVLNKMAMERIDSVSRKVVGLEEFKKQDKLISDINQKLKEVLTKDQMDLVGQLQDEINAYSGIFEIEVYLQGLKDGIGLNKELDI